jgi:hypothetical protein
LPPILAFQSLVDATVVTRQLMTRLFDCLPVNGSELVLFDINRRGVLDYFVSPQHEAMLEELEHSSVRNYTYTLLSNKSSKDEGLEAIIRHPGSDRPTRQPLAFVWPGEAYSLSHVALPFPLDDEIYGYLPETPRSGFPALGQAQMVGESGALTLPASLSARIRSNPFHDYIEGRILELIDEY